MWFLGVPHRARSGTWWFFQLSLFCDSMTITLTLHLHPHQFTTDSTPSHTVRNTNHKNMLHLWKNSCQAALKNHVNATILTHWKHLTFFSSFWEPVTSDRWLKGSNQQIFCTNIFIWANFYLLQLKENRLSGKILTCQTGIY